MSSYNPIRRRDTGGAQDPRFGFYFLNAGPYNVNMSITTNFREQPIHRFADYHQNIESQQQQQGPPRKRTETWTNPIAGAYPSPAKNYFSVPTSSQTLVSGVRHGNANPVTHFQQYRIHQPSFLSSTGSSLNLSDDDEENDRNEGSRFSGSPASRRVSTVFRDISTPSASMVAFALVVLIVGFFIFYPNYFNRLVGGCFGDSYVVT